jgi:transcriptional regulator with GAF, ATPase, and Fis domain
VADPIDRESLKRFGIKASVISPFTVSGRISGAVSFTSIRAERHWPPDIIERLRLVASVFGQALARRDSEEQLARALTEVQQLRDQLALENQQLRREVKVQRPPRAVVSESEATRRVLEQIESVAPTNATVLLLGETGSGKEVFAQTIHRQSPRHQRPMVLVNCAAIPATLIESELFGRERGAYTGALAKQVGRFEMAEGSTIFLDEIGDLPLEAQVKLLRVLQDKVIERLGSSQPIKVDVRIIAATNRNLEKAVADKTFREDLFYRLNVFPITVPPLRERIEDLPGLVWTFVEEYSTAFGKHIDSITKDSLAALQRYSWPGNVRELRNVVERAMIVARAPRLTIDVPQSATREPEATGRSIRLKDLEAEHIKSVLESVGWRVRGSGGAAELLGVKPTTLDSRMAKLGIRRPTR